MRLISFYSQPRFHGLGQPGPIKNFLPKWYRDAEATISTPSGEEVAGLKKCAPFLDAMIDGYALVTPFDIYVSEDESGKLKLSWDGPDPLSEFISERDAKLGHTLPRPAGHRDNHLAFRGFWGWKTPRGWSVLVVHPLNRFDLPFTITSGIIESDNFTAPGNVPFFIKEGFTGTIPAGTPFAQLIPMKRADWAHVENNTGLLHLEEKHSRFVRDPKKNYKHTMWRRKNYK